MEHPVSFELTTQCSIEPNLLTIKQRRVAQTLAEEDLPSSLPKDQGGSFLPTLCVRCNLVQTDTYYLERMLLVCVRSSNPTPLKNAMRDMA